MIKLYSDFKFAPDNIVWVRCNDIFFNFNICTSMLTSKDLSLMREIERLTLLSKENNLLMSRTGIISIANISTSLKTLLNIRWLKRRTSSNARYGVDITECGFNVLNYVFDEVTDGTIPVVLGHWDVLGLKNRYIEVNDTVRVKSMNKLFDLLG